MASTEEDIKKSLLRKFYKGGYWGKHHMREDNIPKGFPGHIRGIVMDVAEDLRRQGILCKKPSGHDNQWFANIERLAESERIIND